MIGAKDEFHIAYANEFQKHGLVYIATENKSLGTLGDVTDLLDDLKSGNKIKQGNYFFNCGPRAMVEAVLPLELKISSPERIYSSVDYMTRCGIGICGSCANEKGLRTCIEGPFMNEFSDIAKDNI